MLSPGIEFYSEALLPLCPAIGVHRWFDMDEMFCSRMKSHNIQLTIVTTSRALTDADVSPQEIALVLVPFSDKLFEIICCHFGGWVARSRMLRRRAGITPPRSSVTQRYRLPIPCSEESQ